MLREAQKIVYILKPEATRVQKSSRMLSTKNTLCLRL